MSGKRNSNHHRNMIFAVICWLFCVTIVLWLLSRSTPTLVRIDVNKSSQNFTISSELTSLSERLSCLWTSTRDKILRKHTTLSYHRYGLQFKNLHHLLVILLAGDIATNPGPNNQHLRCLSFNAQSIRSTRKLQDGTYASNLKSFQDLIYAEELDLVFVTETWLNDNIKNNEILPKGYNIVRKDRAANQRGGGVFLAIRDDISYSRLTAGKSGPNWSDRLEIIAIEFELSTSKKCLACVCYRSPSCDCGEWLELFTAFLETTTSYEKVLITGDFNFPDLSWNSEVLLNSPDVHPSTGSTKFKELTFDLYLHQVNMYPTRLNHILDLVLTSAPEYIDKLSCIPPSTMGIFTDHHLMFFDLQLHVKSTGCDKRTVFNFQHANWDALYETLSHLDLTPSEFTDIDTDWTKWKDSFLGAAAKHIPRKNFKRRSTPLWIDGEVKHLLQKKDSCRRAAKRKSCSSLWEKYRELRRKTKSIIHAKRKKFFESLPALLSSSTKKFWSAFKSVSKHSNVPNKMTWSQPDGVKYSANNPSDIANLLNQYFYSVFKTSDSNDDEMSFPNSNVSYSDTSEGTISSITLTPEEVYHVLVALDENKATGPDKISAKLLKNCASIVCSSLCALFNKSLSSGKFPYEWKLSNVIPIPKKGPAEDVSNYRPISLLSLVSKVFERCVYNQLISHISTQLHHLQFGFLRGKSTTSQLLHVLQDIHKALENRSQVDVVYLDFAKAFDKVRHNLLLTKLHKFGIRGELLCWLKDYLSGRHQRVTVLGETSGLVPVLSGVPQGSILGPLLFLVYVNDLPHCISGESTVAMFADDTKCYRPVRDLSDCDELQNDLNDLVNWCTTWKMDLNQSKCGIMSITRSRQPITTKYTLQDNPMKPLTHQKDLGIVVTKDLKWKKQVEEISSKANSMLGFIRRTASEFVLSEYIYLCKIMFGTPLLEITSVVSPCLCCMLSCVVCCKFCPV